MKDRKRPGKTTKAEERRRLKRAVKDAFSLWTEVGRMASGDVCEKCGMERGSIGENGRPRYLDTHHVVIREVHSLRFDPRNCCVLCHNCHKFGREGAHRGTIVFSEWFRRVRGADYAYLLEARLGEPVETLEDVSLAMSMLRCEKARLFRAVLSGAAEGK